MITQIMPSAKQIKARKAFVKKYAKKGKRSKPTNSTKKSYATGFPKGTFTAKKNAEISKVEAKMQKIEDELLAPKVYDKMTPARRKREAYLTKQYRKLQDEISYIQFRKYRTS